MQITQYILIVFFIIIICMLGILIYIMMNMTPKKEIQYIHIQQPVSSENKENKDVSVYPKKLPDYDNNEFQQIGILSANEADKEPIILPLFAKRLRNNRDIWQYYTATDKNNMMRLPIVHYNMKCDDDIGCKEIYDGDKLHIEIYQGRIFTATIYKTAAPKYFADVY